MRRKLRKYACILVGGMAIVIDCGVSADDLVSETLGKFFGSPNGLGWKESKGPLGPYLGKVLRNLFIDHLRREAKRVKPGSDFVEPTLPDQSESALDRMAFQELQDALLEQIKGREDENELKEYILAASMTTADGKVNQQFADLLRIEVREVINRRNRLLRVARVVGQDEEFRHGRETDKSVH